MNPRLCWPAHGCFLTPGVVRLRGNVPYLLNDAIFNVDVCFLGEVIVDHLPSFDEDAH